MIATRNISKLLLGTTLGIFLGVGLSQEAHSQLNRPAVGSWNSYMNYKPVIDFITTDGNEFFCISKFGFFTYKQKEGDIQQYSKANGMNDVELAFIDHDLKTNQVALIYQNGNIDLFQDGKFVNIPDIKITNVSGDRSIFSSYCDQGILYLSTGLGLILVDLEKKQIKETIPFFQGTNQGIVKSASGNLLELYVATNIGLFRTSTSNPLMLNYATWQKVSGRELLFVTQSEAHQPVYVAAQREIFVTDSDSVHSIKAFGAPIQNIQASADGHLWVMLQQEGNSAAKVVKIDEQGNELTQFDNHFAFQFLDENTDAYWSCDGYFGLRKWAKDGNAWTEIFPGGPSYPGAYKVWANQGEIWLAHGGKDYNFWNPAINEDGFSHYQQNGGWTDWKWQIKALPNYVDYYQSNAIDIKRDYANQYTYVAYLYGGLVEVAPDRTPKIIKAPFLENNIDGDTSNYPVTSLRFDEKNNLWLTQSQVQHPLKLKMADGSWHKFRVNGVNHLASLAIDDYGQKWMAAGNLMNGGLVVYNDNNTITQTNDDVTRTFRQGEGQGNLPSNAVNTIAKDKDGAMWVGTQSGVAIFSCGDIRNNSCEAILRPLIAEGFNFANYMFEGIPVKSIAIDGGNRKWIGTNVGLFLLSDDGETLIHQFNEDNSPLLSNNIINLDIDPSTGVVYISTDKGLCSYGGSAIEGGSAASDPIFVFPNPVPSGYQGFISFRDLPEQSNLKITDISGQLVMQATSTGGQYSWNGMDYKGRRVQSGVYIIHVVSKDGTNKAQGKFIIHE